MLSTDDNYNADSRAIEQKVKITFEGMKPVEVFRNDYLVSVSVLEEAHSQNNSTPFGTVTSNEVDIELLNDQGIFTPSNQSSPYYGKMKRGVKIEPFIRPMTEEGEEEYEWDPLGVYYVTDWSATVTGLLATVTANDKLYDLFTDNVPDYKVHEDVAIKDFYKDILALLAVTGDIDDSLTDTLDYAYIVSAPKTLLSDLGLASMVDCFCKHDGSIKVQNLKNIGDVRATITDSNQIISASITQSIVQSYDGVAMQCHHIQESDVNSVLSNTSVDIPNGETKWENIQFSQTPVYRILYTMITGASDAFVDIDKIYPTNISYTVDSADTDREDCSVTFYGTYLEHNKEDLSTEGENLLKVDNIYVQDTEKAIALRQHLIAYLYNWLPILELEIRGNPKFELGDIITAVSTRYNLNYTGVVIKQTFDYSSSGLTGTLTLLNVDILKEVG